VAARAKRGTRARRVPPAAPNPWLNIGEQGRGLHIGHFLTFQIIRLANAVKANVTRRYLIDFGLSVPEWRLLAMTIRYQPVRFSELVTNSSMDKGQASRTLQALTRRGLIASRATGRRAGGDNVALPVILKVTPKGRRLYASVLPVAQRSQARLLRTLTRRERKALYTIIGKLFETIGTHDKLT
jgi:DNA-binding MarR family transcriptional regulator